MRKHFSRQPAGGAEVFPQLPGDVDECHSFNIATFQISKNLRRLKVRQLTNQQVNRLRQKRVEILRLAQVRTMPRAPLSGFNQETIRRQIARSFCFALYLA